MIDIFITGSTGAIGQRILPKLEEKNFNVISLVRYKSSIKNNSNEEIVYYKNNNIILHNKSKVNYKPYVNGSAFRGSY